MQNLVPLTDVETVPNQKEFLQLLSEENSNQKLPELLSLCLDYPEVDKKIKQFAEANFYKLVE